MKKLKQFKPLWDGSQVSRLRTSQAKNDLKPSVIELAPGDYLTRPPSGGFYGAWTIFPDCRRPVVERMLAAGVPVPVVSDQWE